MKVLDQGDDQAVGQDQEGGDGIHDHAVRHDAERGGDILSKHPSYPVTRLQLAQPTVHFNCARSLTSAQGYPRD